MSNRISKKSLIEDALRSSRLNQSTLIFRNLKSLRALIFIAVDNVLESTEKSCSFEQHACRPAFLTSAGVRQRGSTGSEVEPDIYSPDMYRSHIYRPDSWATQTFPRCVQSPSLPLACRTHHHYYHQLPPLIVTAKFTKFLS